MNNENKLAKNKFIKELNTKDLPVKKVKDFANYLESKIKNQQDTNIIQAASQQYIIQSVSQQKPEGSNYLQGKSNNYKGASFEPQLNYVSIDNPDTYDEIEYSKVISIDTGDRDTDLYPNPNNFKWQFDRAFSNITKIELISTEIPNTDQTIKNTPVELANNTMTWINKEDSDLNIFIGVDMNTVLANTIDISVTNVFIVGTEIDVQIFNSKLNTDLSVTGFIDQMYRALVINSGTIRIKYTNGIPTQGTCNIDIGYPIYTVNFVPGNYNGTTLINQIQTSLNLVKRRGGTGQFHYFNVSLNNDTNIITFESVITKQLSTDSIATTSGSTIITVTSINHGFKTGNTVRMIGVINTAGISGTVLNGDFIVTMLDFNTFQYEINTAASSTINGGGTNVLTGAPSDFKFLFQTSKTLIQYNIGFNNEDSSEFIGAENPITTKSLDVTTTEISISGGFDILRFTTDINHELEAAISVPITFISTGFPCTITTGVPHGIQLPLVVSIKNSDCSPSLDGDLSVTPLGPFHLSVSREFIDFSGTTGTIFYGGDSIKVYNLKTSPPIEAQGSTFKVISVPNPNQIEVIFRALSITEYSNVVIGTEQLKVTHPNHKFNYLTEIKSINSTFTLCKSALVNNYSGRYLTNVQIIDGPATSNTVDLVIPLHGLITSDIIRIANSTTDPIVDGSYKVQVLSQNELRINFVHATLVDGTATVSYGTNVNINYSNSLPKINGSYIAINKYSIFGITTGTTSVTINTNGVSTWQIGDHVTISNTDSTPDINGIFVITAVPTTSSFQITPEFSIVSPGTTGLVTNNNSFKIETGMTVTVQGTYAKLQREQNIILYRVLGETLSTKTLGGISISNINNNTYDIFRIIDKDTYIIRLLNTFSDSTVTGGGSDVYISSQVSGWRTHQANTITGNYNDGSLLARAINLSGETYILLVSETLNGNSTMKVSSKVNNVLGKILLKESPGLWNYDSFITSPTIFSPSKNRLADMDFRMVTRDNYTFNFKNINYSFTLRISGTQRVLKNSFKNTRTS